MNDLAKKIGELMSVAQERRMSFLIIWDNNTWSFELRGQNHRATYCSALEEGLDETLQKVMKTSVAKATASWNPTEIADILEKFPEDEKFILRFTSDFRKGTNGRVFGVKISKTVMKKMGAHSFPSWEEHSALSHDAGAALNEAFHKAAIVT
jgi:hypothetical protein